MRLNRTPDPLDRNARNGENDNWDIIEGETRRLDDKVGNILNTLSEDAFNKVVDDIRLNWSHKVDNFTDLPTNPKKGDTIAVENDDMIYRYDGSNWIGVIPFTQFSAIAEIDNRLTSQLAEKANEESTNNSLNVLKNKKIDDVKFDVSSNKIKFYANEDEVGSIDITESENSGLVQGYIDSLVADGLIAGVTLSDDSVGENQLKDKSVTSEKMHKNANIKFPYFSDDTFDLDYYWDDKTVIASGSVKNNPFGTGCEIINFRGKTSDIETQIVWVPQVAVAYGSGAKLGEAKIRLVIGDETNKTVVNKSEWKPLGIDVVTSDMLSDDYAFRGYFSDASYDANKANKEGNYLLNKNVKNNPFNVGCALKVSDHKLSEGSDSYWLIQTAVAYGFKHRGKQAYRIVSYYDDEFEWASEWRGDVGNKTINILWISNSFGLNTAEYIHRIANSADVNIINSNLYISGGLLEDHYNNMINDSKVYRFNTKGNEQGEIINESINDVSIEEAINMRDWDYVVLNQASSQSGVYDTFQPYLSDIIDYVKNKLPNVKIALMPTWSYSNNFDDSRFDKYDNDQMTMYNAIMDAYKSIMSDIDFDVIIPAGTAIQNARTDEYLKSIDDELTRDGYHLGDTGMYIAGLTFFKTFFDNMKVDWKPSSVSKRAAHFANISADTAILNSFIVTQV